MSLDLQAVLYYLCFYSVCVLIIAQFMDMERICLNICLFLKHGCPWGLLQDADMLLAVTSIKGISSSCLHTGLFGLVEQGISQ